MPHLDCLRGLMVKLTRWTGEIEDRGSEGVKNQTDLLAAQRDAAEKAARVEGIKAEVKIVARRYARHG